MAENPKIMTLAEVEKELELSVVINDDDDAQEGTFQKILNDQEPVFMFRAVKSGQTSEAISSFEGIKDGHQESASQKNLNDQEPAFVFRAVKSGQTSEATSVECIKDGHQEPVSVFQAVKSGQTSEATSSLESIKDGHLKSASQKNLNDQEPQSGQVERNISLLLILVSEECKKDGPRGNVCYSCSGNSTFLCFRGATRLQRAPVPHRCIQQCAIPAPEIPRSSVSEELPVFKELRFLTDASNSVRTLFGQVNGFFSNKLLNPKSIERSYSDAALQSCLVTIAMNITGNDEIKVKIVKDCPDALPFLVMSLTCQRFETRRLAVAKLASEDPNINMIGKSGVSSL